MISPEVREQSQAEDLRLLRRYADTGDADAYRLVARRYLDFVYTVCLRELRNAQAAEDATQETFISLAKQARRLRADTVLPAWLFTVALAKCGDAHRREARRRKLERLEEPRLNPPGLELQLALASLAPVDQEVVILRVLLEYSHAEVGRTIGVSEDAARMRTERALKRLRERAGAGLVLNWPMEHAVFQVQNPPILNPGRVKRTSAWVAGGASVFLASSWVALRTAGQGSSVSEPTLLASPTLSLTAASLPNADSLLPMHAKVAIYEGDKEIARGDTWRTREIVRWRQSSFSGNTEAEVRGGLLRSMVVGTATGPNVGAIMLAGQDRKVVETDAFEAGLLQLPAYIYTTPSLPLVPLPAAKTGTKTVQADGRTYKIWFDAKHQNRVSKVDFRFKDHHLLSAVVRWQTVSGVVLPAELSQQSWYADAKTSTRRIVLSDVTIGEAAPKPPAMPKPERGALVIDERRNVIFRVDENWKTISKEQPVGNGNVGPGGEPISP